MAANCAAGAAELFLLILWVAVCSVDGQCAGAHEDCSHSGCCIEAGFKCYKKNGGWAGCRPHCTPGIHHHDPPAWRTPWSCEVVDKNHRDCAAVHENCGHLGCCKDQKYTCYQKDVHWASCRESCTPGIHIHDPPNHRTPWSCRVIGGGTGPGPSTGGPTPSPHGGWMGTLKSTHFWDCNGMGCDATTLNPWNEREYKAAPQYAPVRPEHHGGAKYGEKLWMVGAASDALSGTLGPDSDCCGSDNGGGSGCGKCLLVQNPTAVNSDWTAVVMKKSRCPPHSAGCDAPHMDFAVPGFDHLQYTTANVCGSGAKSQTYISKSQSGICGSVPPKDCNCHGLPSNTREQRALKDGCWLFKEWGWHHGVPNLNYKPVECPAGFVARVRVGAAFDSGGVTLLSMLSNFSALNLSNSSALNLDAALAGIDTSTRLKLFSFPWPIFLFVGGGVLGVLCRRFVPQVQRLWYSRLSGLDGEFL